MQFINKNNSLRSMASPKSYEIVSCQHQTTGSNCRTCGSYVDAGSEALKTYRFLCDHHVTGQRYLRAIRNKNAKYRPKTDKLGNSESIHDFLQTIVEKFEFSG